MYHGLFLLFIFFRWSAHSEKIIFGQTCAHTGSVSDIGFGMYHGIKAAFHEQNRLGGVRGNELELVSKDDAYDINKALVNSQEFISNGSIFGLIGVVGSPTSEVILPVAIEAKFPLIGTYSGANFLRKPFSRYSVNLRPSYSDEAAAMVEFLVRKGTRRISLLYQADAFGLDGRAGVFMGLRSKNLRVFSEGNYTVTNTDISQALHDIETKTAVKFVSPEAIIMIATSNAASEFVIAAKKKWPDIFIMGSSPAGTTKFLDKIKILAAHHGINNWYENLIIIQILPIPTNTMREVVSKYQSALRNYNETLSPDFTTMEGYLVGRLTIEALFRIPGEIGREAFLDAIYDSGRFKLHNLPCGPLIVPGIDFFGDSSGCNQCMRSIWGTQFTQQGYVVEAIQANFAFSSCGYKPKEWNYLRFGIDGDMNHPFKENVIMGIEAAFQMVNDEGGIHGSILNLNVSFHNHNHTQSLINTKNFIKDFNIFGLLGYYDEMSINNTFDVMEEIPMIGFMPGLNSLRHPFNQKFINMRLSFLDEAAIMTTLLTDQGLRGISVIYLDTEINNDGIQGMTMGLKSVREIIRSHAIINITSNEEEMKRNIQNSLDQIDSESRNGKKLEGILLLTSENIQLTVQLLVHGIKRWSDLFFVVSNSFANADRIGNEIVEAALKNSIPIERIISKLYLTQAVPSPDDTNLEIVQEYQKAMHNIDASFPLSTVSLETYLSAHILTDVLRRTPGEFSRKNILDTFYSGSRFEFHELSIGPFQDEKGKTCNQGLNKVWLKKVSINGSLEKLWDGSYSLPLGHCGYRITPQYDFDLNGIRMIPFQLSIAAILFITVTLFLTFRNRTHYAIKPGFIFSILTGIGLILTICINLLSYNIPDNLTCSLMPWAIHGSFVITFAPLFAKTHRISIIFNNPTMKKVRLTDNDLYLYVFLILTWFIVLMIYWSAGQGLPKAKSAFQSDGRRYETCLTAQGVSSTLCIFSEIVLLGWGTILCNRINDINGEFRHLNESKSIGICIYNAIVFGILIMTINFALEMDPNLTYLLNSIIVLANAIVATVVLKFPKLMKVYKRRIGFLTGGIVPPASSLPSKTSGTTPPDIGINGSNNS